MKLFDVCNHVILCNRVFEFIKGERNTTYAMCLHQTIDVTK